MIRARDDLVTVVPNCLWESQLSVMQRMLYIELIRLYGPTGSCAESHSVIAERCGVCRRTVQDGLKALEREGWIRIRRQSGRAGVIELDVPH